MTTLPAHASPAFTAIHTPQAERPNPTRHISEMDLDSTSTATTTTQAQAPSAASLHAPHLPPPSIISPAFTPPSTPGRSTPAPVRDAVSVPVDTTADGTTTPPALLETLPHVECIVRARIPTTTGQEMFLHVYQNDVDNKEHLAIVFGNKIRSTSLDTPREGESERDRMIRGAYVGRLYPGRTSSRVEQLKRDEGIAGDATADSVSEKSPLVRIHSECYTGETVWSARCDCGEQLDEAARLMALPSSSGGVIIYLRQEGRGIGLAEKLKAYNLQDLGNDTYEANLLLRHPADARSYGLATAMLCDLGLGGDSGIRLLTNNPDKIRAVEGPNREVVVNERVEMVPLAWKRGEKGSVEVEQYLSTKIEKFKHMLSPEATS
ncbi:uncharacterized protein K452DRAFT_299298 [Aplosporella prunicola CBS 121167]|uniref:GTP cyclohydrolase II n=1 Tax=Aplosporella prunicola CBS 121167 TaxID=1176127 RepID=A0A6A6B8J9_9PEZI|nr:uncharacterized protein K452DRAFT_299298 [Aplosporella prunicola CBS 121167]KAF2140552.1 hypothetical protein K452DRAFT_299298 [Aplosporella prunicola CBS 121167]